LCDGWPDAGKKAVTSHVDSAGKVEVMSEKICIRCGGKLSRGKAKVHGTTFGFVLFGWSWTKLFFAPNGDSRSEFVLAAQGRGLEAFECSRCGSIELTGNQWVA